MHHRPFRRRERVQIHGEKWGTKFRRNYHSDQKILSANFRGYERISCKRILLREYRPFALNGLLAGNLDAIGRSQIRRRPPRVPMLSGSI
jgi:hypothetical protein